MDNERFTDALDHIMRVARQSDTMTKRLKFIELRAKSALEGTDEWREYDYPKNRNRDRERLREKLNTALAEGAKVRELLMRSGLFRQFTEQDFWHAHHVDLLWRFNGEDRIEEADWLKELWYLLRKSPVSNLRASDAGIVDYE